jgi:hypothetical protein
VAEGRRAPALQAGLYGTCISAHAGTPRLSALEWVQDKGTEWLFSFTNICDFLGFDPDYLREVLLKRENKFARPVRGKGFSFPAVVEQE